MNIPLDIDLKLEPDGSFAILTNHRDVTLHSAIEHQRAMRMFAEEYGVYDFLLDTRGKSFSGTYVDLSRRCWERSFCTRDATKKANRTWLRKRMLCATPFNQRGTDSCCWTGNVGSRG